MPWRKGAAPHHAKLCFCTWRSDIWASSPCIWGLLSFKKIPFFRHKEWLPVSSCSYKGVVRLMGSTITLKWPAAPFQKLSGGQICNLEWTIFFWGPDSLGLAQVTGLVHTCSLYLPSLVELVRVPDQNTWDARTPFYTIHKLHCSHVALCSFFFVLISFIFISAKHFKIALLYSGSLTFLKKK